MLECVVNISEGRDIALLAGLAEAVSGDLLDVHTDPDHNRSVFTLVGERAPRDLARLAVGRLSIGSHDGVHPRLGVVDVVPFVPLAGSTMADAERARDEFASWVSTELSVPSFLYGTGRTLPYIRAHAWKDLDPDAGPTSPHPTAGAVCVGARMPLVAYNVWLRNATVGTAREIAREVRTEHIRTLGLQVGGFTQVSMNLVSPDIAGPVQAFESVAESATRRNIGILHAELVGLLPADVLDGIPEGRWEELDLSADRTIESRLKARGISR